MVTSSRCGFVALCGKPNAGKSTLFNRLVDARLSVATGKPQTTRHNIRGICTRDEVQFVFVDTPGIASGRSRGLSRVLNATARAAAASVDVAVLVVEAGVWNERDEQVARHLQAQEAPVVLCANKIDHIKREALLPYFARLADREFSEYVPVSARTGEGCDHLREVLARHLPPGPHRFDPEMLSDRPERFFAAERIREQIMVQLHEEVPYATHVEIENYREQPQGLRIDARILVERATHKAILIGAGGARLRSIGTAARKRLAEQLGRPVHLALRVSVRDWTRDARIEADYRGEV